MTIDRSVSELTVAELSDMVASAIRGIPGTVSVRGLLVDLGKGYRRHIFASLREGGMGIRCFIPARVVGRMPGELAEGDTVVVRGRVELYRTRGDIQLVAESIALVDDTTRARWAVARLQAELERDGLLRCNRSLRMPEMPSRVAVVAGHSSAAVLDIVTALHRRAPWVAVRIFATQLQGDGAHVQIAAAIDAAAASGADVIAVVRGGGAAGDFAPYDSEEVCRAIAASPVPIVCALGHEQDRRLADLAAHTAASTPTDAARHIVPEASQLRVAVAAARRRMANALGQSLRGAAACRTSATGRLSTSSQLVTTRARARAARVGLDQRITRVATTVRTRHLEACSRVLHGIETTSRRLSAVQDAAHRMRKQNTTTLRTRVGRTRDALDGLRHRMHLAHPHNVVARGFVIARDPDGGVVTHSEAAIAAGRLELQFSDRTIVVHVSATPQS
jgi:exodeoxyribonuclease VII large subunit